MTALQVYLKLLAAFKTPLIAVIDLNYKATTRQFIDNLLAELLRENNKYIVDYFDCDDFSFVFKAMASKRLVNSVGLVIGIRETIPHVWNVAICDDGVYQIEPQSGYVFRYDKIYKPKVIVI